MIKNFVLYLLLLLNAAVGSYVLNNQAPAPRSTEAETIDLADTTPPKKSLPQRLVIPKINVDANVEMVGEDVKGNMDVPKDYNNVGWYEYGTVPGDTGNSVIDGHLDTPTGSAVFYRLWELKIGDELTVIDTGGEKYTFEVYKREFYDVEQFPGREVFGKSKFAGLNLITCAGTFDRETQNYSQRLVVFAKLVETPNSL